MTPVLQVDGLSVASAAFARSTGVLQRAAQCHYHGDRSQRCRKSTLFNLISGQIRPHAQAGCCQRHRSYRCAAASHAACGAGPFVPDHQSCFSIYTVFENLQLAAQRLESPRQMLRRIGRGKISLQRVRELVEGFGLQAKLGELAGALSHGEQRRLEIAVALAAKPSVLLLDEPTQGMSHGDTADTARLIRELADDVTILLIEHDIGLVMDISDHIVVMHQGRLLAEGAPAAIRADPVVKTAYFGDASC